MKDLEFLSNQKPFFATLAHTGGHSISQMILTLAGDSVCVEHGATEVQLAKFSLTPLGLVQEQSLRQQTCSFQCDIYLT